MVEQKDGSRGSGSYRRCLMSENDQPVLDSELVDSLLAQNREQLVAMANAVLRDRHEAEDIVQETIAAVWQRLPDIAPEKVTPYLNRAVRRNAIRRKSRRRQYITLDERVESSRIRERDPSGPGDPLDLEDALESLPLTQQSVVRMKFYLGMTFRQIGVSLSISRHTAASRCRYALEKLKRLLSR